MLGRFSCYWGPHAFCYRDKRGGCNIPAFLEVFCFPEFAPYYSASIMTIQKNPGRR